LEKDNYKKYFYKAIRKNYSSNSVFLSEELDKNLRNISKDTHFAKKSSNPIDKRLDFCACFLALVKTLDEQGESFENIRKICLEIVIEYVRPKNKIQQFLKRLPVKLINTSLAKLFIKALNKKVSHKGHPDGFLARIITDKNETYGFGYGIDILECGICKLFQKHHYQKYASILCEVDEITSGLAGLKMIRSGTIALGAKKCDFRYEKETGTNSN